MAKVKIKVNNQWVEAYLSGTTPVLKINNIQPEQTTGNITIDTTSAEWSKITGTLSNQTDLQNALNTKQDKLTQGTNITLSNNTISAKDTTYTFATGDSNGQVKVTPSGGTAQNVSVKGLNTAAYRNVKANVSAKTHTNFNNNQDYLAPMNFLTYWNGAYNSSNSSNLTYAHQGTIQCKPTVLYNNSAGTGGTITLSQTAANFTYIVVYYLANNDSGAEYSPEHGSETIYSPNGHILSLNHTWWYSGGVFQFNITSKYINNKSITTKYNKYLNSDGMGNIPSNDDGRIKIYRVEGWK